MTHPRHRAPHHQTNRKPAFQLSIASALATATALATSAPVAVFAGTTTTDPVTQLATQIVSLSTKIHASGSATATLATPVLQVIAQPGFDWNQVLFGPGTLTAAQSATASAITPDIQQLATFSITDQTTAVNYINGVIAQMQGMNSSIQSADVITFLQNLESEAISAMFPFAGQTNITASAVEAALHTALLLDLQSSSPAIQALFPGDSLSSGSSGGTSGGSGSGSGSGGSTGTSTGSGSGGTSTGTGGSSTTLAGGGILDSIATVLASQTVDTSKTGATLTAPTGDGSLSLAIPANAFSAPETVTLTQVDPTTFASNNTAALPTGYQTQLVIGVDFGGAAPNSPVTLIIQGSSIATGAKVFKVTPQGLIPVQATVTNGQAVVTFSLDPYFVIATPPQSSGQGGSTGSNSTGSSSGSGSDSGSVTTTVTGPTSGNKNTIQWKAIQINGKRISRAPVVVSHGTVYLPIWYVEQALHAIGLTSKWAHNTWNVQVPHGHKLNLTKLKPGHGAMRIELNGKTVQLVSGLTATDPNTGKQTTYMPVWYIIQILKRAGVNNAWSSQGWTLKH